MADQDRWIEDRRRGRYGGEDRSRQGYENDGPRNFDRPGYGGRGYAETYGEDRSFEPGRGEAYGAGYGMGGYGYEGRGYGEPNRRYGGQWGQGPGGRGDEGYGGGSYGGRSYGAPRRGEGTGRYGGYEDEAYRGQGGGGERPDSHDRTWMERAGERVASWLGGGEHETGAGHRGRGPKNYKRSDDRIREDVSDRLTDDSWLDASGIEVQVSDGEVTLAGTVERREDKRRAEDLAERVSGVRHVQNNLRIQPAGESEYGRSFMGGAPNPAGATGASVTGTTSTGGGGKPM